MTKSINGRPDLTHGAHESCAGCKLQNHSLGFNADFYFSGATGGGIHSNFQIFRVLKMSEYT